VEQLLELLVFAGLLLAGLLFGRASERRHYRDIVAREEALADILVFNERRIPGFPVAPRTTLVVGSVVIAEDYFKRVAASLKSLVGGRLTAYESLMDRGRREAVLRMKEEARRLGADMVFNVRFETASMADSAGGRQAMFCAEFIAYGTALIPPRAP
jgi:uncharacterized protein YbjQ (UPF0145 family)